MIEVEALLKIVVMYLQIIKLIKCIKNYNKPNQKEIFSI